MNRLKRTILGFITGDCFGVPYEFLTKEQAEQVFKPYFISGGYHRQRAGTWSDDTTFSLALMDSLNEYEELSTRSIEKLVNILKKNLLNNKPFTTKGKGLFDVGKQTQLAFESNFTINHGFLENGNGGLMRVWPLAIYFFKNNIIKVNDQIEMIKAVLKPTHSHELSTIFSFFYIRMMYLGFNNMSFNNAYKETLSQSKEQFIYESFEDFTDNYLDIKLMKSFGKFESGFVKNTFINVLGTINFSRKFELNIFDMIINGGDADTNTALLGGLYQAFKNEDISIYEKNIIDFERANKIIKKFIK